MSCLSALHTQLGTLLSVPHEILFLRHRVFREYARIAVGTDFIHTLPSFLILTAAVLVLWKNPPSSTRLMDFVGLTFIYKGFQVSVSWLVINTILWLWLILQRILYCSVWNYWSYETEYRDMTYPWWQHVWSSYYPITVQPPVISASFISWIIAMSTAIIALGCANSTDRVETFVKETLIKFRDTLAVTKSYVEQDGAQEMLVTTEANAVMDDGEIRLVCDDGRSETSNETNNATRGEIHPISYGTNWMPQPNFSAFKDAHRKISLKSLHTVTGANDGNQDPDKFAAKQLRHRRGCHTVIPNNFSEQSSEC